MPFGRYRQFPGACGDGALLASSLGVPVPLQEEKRRCCRFTYQLGDHVDACFLISNNFEFTSLGFCFEFSRERCGFGTVLFSESFDCWCMHDVHCVGVFDGVVHLLELDLVLVLELPGWHVINIGLWQ